MPTIREINDRIAEIDERIAEIEESPERAVITQWNAAIRAAKTAYKPPRKGLFGRKKAPEPEPDWEQSAIEKLGGKPEAELLELCREYNELSEERKELSGIKFGMVKSGKSTAQVSLEQSRAKQTQRKKKASGLVCPKCGSEDVMVTGDTKKQFSTGKALVGGAIAGRTGALIAGSTGTKGKTKWVCRTCGHTYTK